MLERAECVRACAVPHGLTPRRPAFSRRPFSPFARRLETLLYGNECRTDGYDRGGDGGGLARLIAR